MTVEIVIFSAVLVGVAAGLLLERMRGRIETQPAAPNGVLRLLGQVAGREPGQDMGRVAARGPAVSLPVGASTNRAAALVESAAQLRAVSDARFQSRRLLSEADVEMLSRVEATIAGLGEDWRVMTQVRLTEIVAASDTAAAAAIDAQRVDLLIVSADLLPLAAVEYQPLGQVRDDDAVRDAVKREALRRAGIAYFEVRASDSPELVQADLASLARQTAARAVPSASARARAVRKPRAKAPPAPNA